MPGIYSFGYILPFPSYPTTILSYYGVGRMDIYSIGLRVVKVKINGRVPDMVFKISGRTRMLFFLVHAGIEHILYK
jgi:hypothetical protein